MTSNDYNVKWTITQKQNSQTKLNLLSANKAFV